MRYADLEAHADAGLGAEEPGIRRYTRPCERAASVSRSQEQLDRLEALIAQRWTRWEDMHEGPSRTNFATVTHRLEDIADSLTEDIRANRSGEESGPGRCSNTAEAITPATASKEEHDHTNP